MAATRTPATAESAPTVAVAFSAGRDSTALLHATARAAAGQGVRVLALHVHHGLSPHADDWLAHAQRQCARWARSGLPVTLVSHRITSRPLAGDSIEAWARRERYRALCQMAVDGGARVVLLAHHERDQAETFLIQALRGAGVAGLAGMPQSVEREGIIWTRPWLRQPRAAIEAYVRRHRLRFVDDDSNEHTRYARNRLRHDVWPALSAAFPQAESSLADAATWAAEAAACLQDLAELDLREVLDDAGLNVKAWQSLSAARQVNALREWLRLKSGQTPSSSLVRRLQRELPVAGAARWEWHHGVLRRHRGHLSYVAAAPLPQAHGAKETLLVIDAPGRYPLAAWGGELVVERVRDGGVPASRLAQVELRERLGGEQFMAGPGRPARSLKKQYQAANVPAWERDGPLVYSQGQLIFVPGLGLDARALATAQEPQLSLSWQRG